MKKIFNYNESLNVFDLWRKTQIKVEFIHKQILSEKKSDASELLDKYKLIFSKVNKDNMNKWTFERNIFVALIKYLMDSNNFFDKRLTENQIDELLLLAYIYEWIVLDKPKDISLLGNRSEVLKKFKKVSTESKSWFRTIFDDIDIYSLEDWPKIIQRIDAAADFCFSEILSFIIKDNVIYQKILDESYKEKDFDNKDECLKNWNKSFLIKDNNLNYVYSIQDSDMNLIYVSVETDNDKVAFVKFKLFKTYSKEDNNLVPTGISKEISRIDFINKNYMNYFPEIVSNSLKIANRAIKNIFLLDLQLRNDEQYNLEKFKSKKVVNIIKKQPKSESSVPGMTGEKRTNILNKSLGS
ncbi:MAG: hypothetical protein K2J02_03770 [Malacoplasma sp.]|nr:hypothetical protein [Malacoplasma sp.]